MSLPENAYLHVRSGMPGFYEPERGLISVSGKEAVQFLDGMITNDMKTLGDGKQMLAAFPNAQGRLLALVRVLRQGGRYLIETEGVTRERLYNNLFRFTFAGDFFVEDLSEEYAALEFFGPRPALSSDAISFSGRFSKLILVPKPSRDSLVADYTSRGALPLPEDDYETLRIENGIPRYGVDVDETTVTPEVGIDEVISYSKGCYIGQEIIARIHFRGHVAKRLTGLIDESDDPERIGTETPLKSPDGRDAGRITSATFSPALGRNIAIGLVRYDYLSDGTGLLQGDRKLRVAGLPFIR
jgi:folate-binding protein YgfZ